MRIIDIHYAKTHLFRLVDEASKGESFVIAKAGKPVVKVMAIDSPHIARVRRLDFLAGEISVPDDFDRMGSGEFEKTMGGDALHRQSLESAA